MRIAIEAILDYDFACPTDVLLAVEAAAVPDQRVLTQSHIINNAGPLTNKVGGSGIGRRTWTRTGTGRMVSTYRATMAIDRAPIEIRHLPRSPLPSLLRFAVRLRVALHAKGELRERPRAGGCGSRRSCGLRVETKL